MTLQDAFDALGGIRAAADAVFPEEPPKRRYDRMFQWQRRGRLTSGHVAERLAHALQKAGHPVEAGDLIHLVGREAA